ncbi:DUF317 domain-containing protein [Streptomyces sp. NPDC059928]|uniref:DUF317 domain-containing protein n=1 Tax=unclassified Streptomyces TaxID=2593676 RepID=UPI003655F9CA
MPQLLGDARHADRIPITDIPLEQIAELNHWSAHGNVLTSPDHYCRLEHTPGQEIAWQVEHLYYEGAPLATFTQDTPEGLVANFFSHLAAPMAVERAFADIPLSTRYEHTALITPVRGTAVNPHIHHTLAQFDHTDPPGRRH